MEAEPAPPPPFGLCPRCRAGLRRQAFGLPLPDQDLGDWEDLRGCILGPESRALLCPACGLGLGRLQWHDPGAAYSTGPERMDYGVQPFQAWADYQWAVLRCLELEAEGLPPWTLDLSVPQQSCCFRFGPRFGPLSVGALLRLWERDPAARTDCPRCGGPGRAEGVGGLINVGGYRNRCLHCGHAWLHPMGGMGKLWLRLRPLLEGTPWYLNGAAFGAVVGSDGRSLGQALELPGWEGATAPPVFGMRLGQLELRLDLEER